MLQFVGENHLDAVKSMIAGAKRFDAAVAFWGQGAIKQLGLGGAPHGGTVVCNLFSPGCNPHEIERLFNLKQFNLRNHAGLHGKVYLTDQSVCIGSSNASGAGLGFEEFRNSIQREANIICSDPDVLKDASRWLTTIIQESKEVLPADLAEAKRRHQLTLPAVTELIDLPLSVLQQNKIAVLLWSEEVTDKVSRQIRKMPEAHFDNVDWYVDLPKNATKYPYGYHCLTYRARGERLQQFEGIQFFQPQSNWKEVIEEGINSRVIFAFDCKKYNGIWTLPTRLSFTIGQKSLMEIRDRLLKAKLKLRTQLKGPNKDFGFLHWEPLHLLLESK